MYLDVENEDLFQQWKFVFSFTVVHMYMFNQFWVPDAYLAPSSLKFYIVLITLLRLIVLWILYKVWAVFVS